MYVDPSTTIQATYTTYKIHGVRIAIDIISHFKVMVHHHLVYQYLGSLIGTNRLMLANYVSQNFTAID